MPTVFKFALTAMIGASLVACATTETSPVSSEVAASAQNAEWRTLSNGSSLTGWRVHGGAHEYSIADGVITGMAVEGEPNAFLIPDGIFDDFIFELEFLSDGRLNSGVIFRGDSDPEYRDGRLFGYQAEIDPSPRGWTGGLFEEALRGWLVPIDDNEACRASFRAGDWNTMRIEALGPELRIYLNGVSCVQTLDESLTQGVFGLQVHSVAPGGRMGEPGNTISWRNVRLLTQDVAEHRLP